MAVVLSRVCGMALLLIGAGAFPVYDVTAGTDLGTNPGRGTVFTTLGALDSSKAIQCYADYGNGGAGTCNVLSVGSSDLEILSTFVFNDNETHAMSVAPFSSAAAVVCYSDKGNTKRLMCKSLSVSGSNALSGSEPVLVNAEAEEVPTLSLASLSETTGVLCWSYVQYSAKDRAGVCNKVTLGSGAVTVGDDYFFDVAHSTSQISVSAFSDASAVVCYSAQGAGTCTALSLDSDGAGGADFAQGGYEVFHQTTAEFFESIATVRYTAARGAVCYADGTDTNMLACKALLVDGSDLTVGSEAEVVSEYPTAWMTATAITDSYALVCYATEEGGNVNGEEFRGLGTCNVLGLTGDNMTVGAGPPNEVNSNPTEHMSLVSLDAMSAVLCYSDLGAGAGHCMPLSMAPTTTTTTATTSTSTSSTVTTSTSTTTTSTLTSSTETSTATDTSVTTATSTTSFHTTTATETTGTTVTEGPVVDSGSTPPALLSAGAAALAAALVAAAEA